MSDEATEATKAEEPVRKVRVAIRKLDKIETTGGSSGNGN
jgi:hypothetical protein